MDLRQLRYFVKIVELESITAAAHELFIAQPSLSQQVSNLETELDVKLLNRGSQGTKPTIEGERFCSYAKIILRQVEEAKQAVAGGGPLSGNVSLGLPSSTMHVIGSELWRRVQAAHPGVVLEIVEGSTAYLIDLISKQRLDVCIAPDINATTAFDSEALVEERLIAVGPPGASPRDSISIEELAAKPLLLPALPNSVRLRFDAACQRRGITPRIVAVSAAIPISISAVSTGLAWSVLPWASIRYTQGDLQSCMIDDLELRRHLFLCVSRGATASAACQAVARLLKALIRELVTSGTWRHARLVP